MRILLTNDDGPPGINSPFIEPFMDACIAQGWHVTAVIPATQQSWTGKFVTLGNITQSTVGKLILLTASPATCANIALTSLFTVSDFDLVISGPNFGRNIGTSATLSSGTVGAAVEASLLGIRSIALSFAYTSRDDAQNVAYVQRALDESIKIINFFSNHWSAFNSVPPILNINLPLIGTPYADVKVTRFHKGGYLALSQKTPNGWSFNPVFDFNNVEHDSDAWAVFNRCVSVTPMTASFQGMNECNIEMAALIKKY